MVPVDSDRIPPVPPYSGFYYASIYISNTGLSPSSVHLPKWFLYIVSCNLVVLQPQSCRNKIGLGSFSFAHHYSRNHCYFLFLWVLRCFSSPRSPRLTAVISLQLIGLPHSDIHGSIRICQSPWLFAACHVLLRLQEPRHPPYTLSNFSRSLLYVSSCQRSLS